MQASVLLNEGFDDVTTLPGWVMTNTSSPLGTTGWFQGNPVFFGSQSGAPNSYIAANFDNAAFGGNVSNWLITPVLTFQDGVTLTFYTRTEVDAPAPDNLEVRFSSNGSSSAVGDFTSLLLEINPTLNLSGYPADWTQYTVNVVTGGNTTGRLAFHYAVPNTAINADYIGIDSVMVTTTAPEPATAGLVLFGLAGAAAAYRRRRKA